MTTDELKALLDGATPGPWTLDHHGVDDCLADVWTEPGEDEERICENATAEDARLIAQAPALAAEVIALREREARLVEALREISTMIPYAFPDYSHRVWKISSAVLVEIETETGE